MSILTINRENIIGTLRFRGRKGIRSYSLIKTTFNRYSIILSHKEYGSVPSVYTHVYTHENVIAYCFHYVYDTEVGKQSQETYVTL